MSTSMAVNLTPYHTPLLTGVNVAPRGHIAAPLGTARSRWRGVMGHAVHLKGPAQYSN